MTEKTKQDVRWTHWEEGGFVITINGTKVGQTIDDPEHRDFLVEWLEWSLDELFVEFPEDWTDNLLSAVPDAK